MTSARCIPTASPPDKPSVVLLTIIWEILYWLPAHFGHASPTSLRSLKFFLNSRFLSIKKTNKHFLLFLTLKSSIWTLGTPHSPSWSPHHSPMCCKTQKDLTFLLTSCQTRLRFLNIGIIVLWGLFPLPPFSLKNKHGPSDKKFIHKESVLQSVIGKHTEQDFIKIE